VAGYSKPSDNWFSGWSLKLECVLLLAVFYNSFKISNNSEYSSTVTFWVVGGAAVAEMVVGV
jgi:hypothetical protein